MQEKKFNKKYILIATVIIATTCIVSTTIMMSLNKQNKYHSYIKKADSALSRNRYDEAINLYKKAKEFSKEDTLNLSLVNKHKGIGCYYGNIEKVF